MTVIAWDGRYVAADKQSTNTGTVSTVTKLFVDGHKVYAFCGEPAHGMMLVAWLKSGGLPKDHPHEPDVKKGCYIYVFEYGKRPGIYEERCLPFFIENEFMAAGSGRDVALGAMEMGADAKRAVEVACKWEAGCGQGVDVIDLKELASERRDARLEPAASIAGRATAPPLV